MTAGSRNFADQISGRNPANTTKVFPYQVNPNFHPMLGVERK